MGWAGILLNNNSFYMRIGTIRRNDNIQNISREAAAQKQKISKNSNVGGKNLCLLVTNTLYRMQSFYHRINFILNPNMSHGKDK